MFEKQLPRTLVYLLISIFIVHTLATYLSWYWKIPWLDMPMHFAGGFWVGGTFVWIFAYGKGILQSSLKKEKLLNIVAILLGVLVVGLLWEIFGYTIDYFTGREGYDIIDTGSDLFFDLFGGFVAGLYFLKKVNNTFKHNNK